MELHQFKEILLGFLEEITNIPKRSKEWFLDELGETEELYAAPLRFKVLSPYVLVRVTITNKIPDRPNPEPEEGCTLNEDFCIKESEEEICIYKVKFKIYTESNIYYITGIWRDNAPHYFGCQVNSRKSRVGEDWTRGNDLSDGYFCKETWAKMKSDIIRFEMKALSKYVEHGHWKKPKAVGDPSKENTLQGEPYKSSKHAEKGNTRKI